MMTDAQDRYVNAIEWTPGHEPRRDVEYLRATTARLHAEELADILREALEELDEYYRAEYDTDHPYHQDKLAAARDSWAHARDILARIEGEKP